MRAGASLEHLLFDLDGTLTDPRDGIVRCIQHALAALDAQVPDAAALERYIGPPLRDTFRALLPGREHEAERAVALYRERFVPLGMFENRVYEGIPALLEKLAGEGRTLHLCTSKPHPFARRILEHFALDAHFASVHGSELDGTRNDKGKLVAHVLQVEGLRAQQCALIGDRRFDVEAALENGLTAIGVLWGYGSREELEAAGATRLAHGPDALRELLAGAPLSAAVRASGA